MVSEKEGALDKVRGILESGCTDAEMVGAIREVVVPPRPPRLEVQLDDRRWPILSTSSAWERHDDPEMQ